MIDVPNDDGTNLGVLFRWLYATTPETKVTIEVQVGDDILDAYRLSANEQKRLDDAMADLVSELAPWLPVRDRLQAGEDKAYAAYMEAKTTQR